MSLRGDWEKAKAAALKEAKKIVFPVKFKEDLGPTLDKWEKAKPSDEKNVLAGKAIGVISNYTTAIQLEKKELTEPVKQKLVKALKDIGDKVKAGQKAEEAVERKELLAIIEKCNKLIPQMKSFSVNSDAKDKLWIAFHAEVERGLGNGFSGLNIALRQIQSMRGFPSKTVPSSISSCTQDLELLVEACKKELADL